MHDRDAIELQLEDWSCVVMRDAKLQQYSLHCLPKLHQTSFNIFSFGFKKKTLLLCTVWEVDEQQIADSFVDTEIC